MTKRIGLGLAQGVRLKVLGSTNWVNVAKCRYLNFPLVSTVLMLCTEKSKEGSLNGSGLENPWSNEK